MDPLKYATGASVPLESVLCTEELQRRPSRPPDYQAENQALLALAQELTNSPGGVLQRLVDIALELCQGHSAGISLLEEGPPGHLSPRGDHFRWHAVAGQWAPLIWDTTTRRDYGPCGTVLDRNCTLLFANAHLYYAQFAGVEPLLIEGLLVPFHVDGQAVGTVWVVAHDDSRKFDAEDQRLLESLATFAATAYQARLSLSAQAKANQDLQAEIAERQRAEEALRQSEQELTDFFENAAVGLHWVGADGTLLRANQAELDLLGYTRDAYVGHHIAEFHADQDVIDDILRRLTRGETLHSYEARLRCKDGTLKHVLIDSNVLWGTNGEFRHTRCFTRDVTDRKRAEEALRDSERRFRAMIDALPAAIYTTDAEGRLTHFNPAAVAFSGRVPELGTDQWCVSWKLSYPDGTPMPHEACPMAIALKEGRAVLGAEAIAERPDGTRRWFTPYPTPLRDSAGRIVGGINMLLDITERKQAEALLAAQNQAFAMAASGVPLLHVLEGLVRAVESHAEQRALTAIHLLDASGTRFAQTAAPSLPPAYAHAINGMDVGAATGPCCAAVARRQRVAVADVAASQEFAAFAAFAVPLGIRAGWSAPIVAATGTVLGTVAHYYREVREPHPQDEVASAIVTRTAALLIERHQAEEALRAREAALRESQDHITRLNAQLRADLAGMTRLQHVSTRLVQTSDVSALLYDILDAAIAITGADMGNIQLLDGDPLKIVAHRGFDAPFLAFFNTVHEGLAACGMALQRGERVIVEDVAASPLFAGSPACDVMLAAQARAVQSTPLITRAGRVLGRFSTHYRTPHRPAPRELRLLDLLARQAADFIERTQAEDTVRQRTAQFETLLNAAPLGVYVVDADFRIRQVNPTALPVFGDIPDLIGRDFDEVIHRLWSQAYADEIVRLFCHTLETGEPYITPERIEERRDRGVTEYYEWQIHRIPLPDGRDGVVCYFRDISAQVLARQAIAASEARYRTLTATLEQRVAERTALLALIQDVTRAANEAPSSAAALQYGLDRLCAYTGWPIGHVYLAVAPGADRWAPTALWHLDAPERFTAFQQATQALEVAAGEGLVGRVGARGQPEWQSDVATDPTFQRRHAAQAAGLSTGVAWPILVGHEVVGVLECYTSEPLAPHPALLEAMTQIGTQLGRTVERERAAEQAQRQQEALLQREKLAAMSTMLASVAHELNNPLASILLQADLLREEAGSGPLAETAAELTQAATRCERLVRTFLTLARQHAPERTAVDLNALLTDTLELLAPVLRVDDIAVARRLADDLPRLWADPHQLQQVLVNLLTNAQQALHAVAPPRQVTLTTRYDPARPQVTLEVADTGPGMPPAVRARIFEPFFTTKPPGVGTGLGLPLCQGIIEGHGGTMSVTSLPGQGTTFRIALPVGVVPETAPVLPDSEGASPPVPSAAILLVDDEPGIVKGLTRLLTRDGHRVDTAANGRLALAQLQARPYDLILSDLRMPELDGPGLYRALAQQAPPLCRRFIFLTGDTLSPETLAFFDESGVPRLTKPFTVAEVRRVIAQAWRAG